MARLVLAAALAAGVSYLWVVATGLDGGLAAIWKGSGVALLALWCAMQARSFDGWLIAAVMALGAAGDVLLETNGTIPGAGAFLAGHIVAIGLYLRNRRLALTASQKLLAVVIPAVVLFKAWGLTGDPIVMLYTLFLGVMASCAWVSRFPRYASGFGALMFVASDLLIFAQMGPFAGVTGIGFAIWALYFGGQALIAVGVVRTLQSEG